MATCIPFANGVPAASGPPNWWDPPHTGSTPEPTPGARFNQRIDDPRWHGATAITFPGPGGGAAGEQAVFRALHHTDGSGKSYLYLSWWVKTNPPEAAAADQFNDRVAFGLQSGGTSLLIDHRLFNAGSPAPTGAGPFSVRQPVSTTIRTGGGPWADVPAPGPAWTNRSASDLTRVWVRTGAWALATRIPLNTAGTFDDNGINLGALGSAFKLWFAIHVDALPGLIQFQWPRNATTYGGNPPQPVATAQWQSFEARTDPNCGTGVRLTWDKVFTTNPNPQEIRFPTPPQPANTLVARPENLTTADIPQGALQARFRIANWGSQAGGWNDVADPSQLWQEVPADVTANNTNPAPNDAIIPAAGAGGPGLGRCSFTWSLDSAAETDPFTQPVAAPARLRHQCMLVELEGAGLQFINQSVFRNMDVVTASEFEREAEVSVAGLASLGTADRTVYLYLETTNMPETVEPAPGSGERPPEQDDSAFERERERAVKEGEDPEIDSGTVMDHIAERLPTYRVHAYHETGETLTIDGRTHKLLAPQTSFGYVVRHTGPLFGWTPELIGPGLTGLGLTEIAPNLYRLDVPDGGAVRVKTKITAHEEPRRKGGSGCWGRLLDFFRR